MKQNKFLILLFLITVSLSFIGWNNFSYFNNSEKITNYYYYKGQPFYLNNYNGIFIKLKDAVSEQQFRTIIAQYNQLSMPINFNSAELKHFVPLNFSLNDQSLINLVNDIKFKSEVQYCSPVFSPDQGKTLIGVEDEIIVQFKQTISSTQIESYLNSKNLKILGSLDLTGGNSYVLQVPKEQFAIDVANDVHNSGLVNWSEPNLYFTNLICYTPNDAFYPMQWALRNVGNNIPGGITGTADCDMDLDSAWDITLGSNKVIIAISDTGIDTLHEDLAANMVPGTGWNFSTNQPVGIPGGNDDGNHGTACAGIVAAVGNNTIGVTGVAPNCRLIAVKWLTSGGSGNYTGATQATIYSYQQGAWIISNSWGFVGGASSALDQAINDASNLGRSGKGTLFVVASGNENGTMRYPAISHPRVFAIGGISPCNQRKSPSSCDNETNWGASFGTNLGAVAPCVKIYTTDRTGTPGYSTTNYFATFNGTSSATPNAAGVCALVLSRDSTLTWDSVRIKISRTAEKRGSYSYTSAGPYGGNLGNTWNNEMGYGLINARLVLLSMGAPPPPPANDVIVGPFLSLPGSFTVGNNYTIRARVTNGGTNGQTNLPIRFSVNGIIQSTNTIANLPPGTIDSSSFTWNPSAAGSYILRIFSGAPVDENRNNDTVTTNVTVLPSGTVFNQQTFCRNGLNIQIPSVGSAPRDSIVVNIPNSFDVIDVNVRIDTVIHTWDSDLVFMLTKGTTTVTIINRVGGSGDNFINTVLNDSAATPISSGTAPFTGTWRPSNPLTPFNGLTVNGSWILGIDDMAAGDSGVLRAWCIQVTYRTLVGGVGQVEIPNYYSLAQNYPNPFNPNTIIKYSVPKAVNVKLTVYDILGKEVAVLVNETKQPGFYEAEFNASGLATGVYFYKIEAGEFNSVKKMMLVK
jgi:subtilisin family serine protease